jgi:hypothetical protein
MTESYSFYYLNKEGALVTIVDMRCADDQVAMFRVSQFRPPSCASIEIWSGDRCVLKAFTAANGNSVVDDAWPIRIPPHAFDAQIMARCCRGDGRRGGEYGVRSGGCAVHVQRQAGPRGTIIRLHSKRCRLTRRVNCRPSVCPA